MNIVSKNSMSSSQINSDLTLKCPNPQPLHFKNSFKIPSYNNISKPEIESIYSIEHNPLKYRIETSNAISLKSRSNQTSRSSPFSDNKSSRSNVPYNIDPANIIQNFKHPLIERDQKSLREKRKMYKSDDQLENPQAKSNNEIIDSFPMFYSQFETMKLDQITDNFKKARPTSSIYVKARNRMNNKNSGIISKNFLFFKKNKQKNNEDFSGEFLYTLANRIQLFMKDSSFFQEGMPIVINKITLRGKFFNYFKSFQYFFRDKLKGLIREIKSQSIIIVLSNSFESIFLSFLCFYLIALPINVAFKFIPTNFMILDIIFTCLLVIKIFMRYNLLKNDKKILTFDTILLILKFLTYFSYLFALNDILSLCFLLFSCGEVDKILKYFEKKIKFYFLLLAFQAFLLFNSLTCIWIIIENSSNVQENQWLERHNLQYLDKFGKYINIFNYILNLPFAKEFNDLLFEQIFSIFATFLSFSLILYLAINSNYVYHKKMQRKFKKSRDSENIAKFLKKMHIFGKLKEEILGFVGIALEKERKKEAIEKDLSILTQDIREQLIYKAYSNSLEKVKVLTKNFSPEFLQKLLLKVKILEMKPKEIIFEQGDYENQALFLIKEGSIDLYYKSPHSVLMNSAKEDDILGELPFFSNVPYEYTAKSKDFSTLMTITKEDFMETIQNFPNDIEMLIMLKDKINLYKTPNFLNTTCFFCEETSHSSSDCPSILPHPNKRMIIFSLIAQSRLQNRKPFPRSTVSSRRYFHSLKDLHKIQEHAWLLLEKHQESITELLDDIYPSSECDNSYEKSDPITTSYNETSDLCPNDKSFAESKDSKGDLNSYEIKTNEGLNNPPSIFLQTTKKRKSTGSIFEERNEDEEEVPNENGEESDNEGPVSLKMVSEEEKKKSEKTLINEDVSRPYLSEGNLINNQNNYEERKNIKGRNSSSIPSDKFYSEKDSSINANSIKYNNRFKDLQKIISSDRDSRFFTEKDTMHLLQNFDKLEKKVNIDHLNSSSHKTITNTTHGSADKRNLQSILSYSKSTSFISSKLKQMKKRNTLVSSNFYASKSNHNKNVDHSEYLKHPLFCYDFERMAKFDNYFPHNNVQNVVKIMKGNNILRIFNDYSQLGQRYIADLKKSVQSNQANTSYSSKKTQKSKPLPFVKSNDEEFKTNR